MIVMLRGEVELVISKIMFAIEHHYRVNIFYATIDSQLHELNYLFNEDAMELLRLSSALEPREALKSFQKW